LQGQPTSIEYGQLYPGAIEFLALCFSSPKKASHHVAPRQVPASKLASATIVVPRIQKFEQRATGEIATTTIVDKRYQSVHLALREGNFYQPIDGVDSTLDVFEQPRIRLFLSTLKAKTHTECVPKSESWNSPAIEIGFETAALERFDQIQSGL
jgi:hypothetical protein